MSGFKRALVSISSDEYQRLHEAEVRLKTVQKDTPRLLEQVRQESVAQVWSNVERVEQRQAQLETTLSGYNRAVGDFERQINASFIDSEVRMANAIQQNAGMLWENVQSVLSENDQRYQVLVAQEQQARQAQVSALDDNLKTLAVSVSSFEEHRRQMQAMAENWSDAAGSMLQFVQSNYAAELYAPGAVDQYAQELNAAEQNISSGAFEAGLSLAQQAYFHFSNLRLQLEQMESEYRLWQNIAREGALKLVAAAEANQTVQAMNTEGQLLDATLSVDEWTGGRLSALAATARGLLERIQQGAQAISLDELYQLSDESLPLLSQRLEKAVLDARLALLSSQMRVNIADIIVSSLEEQGFSLQHADYMGGDLTSAYAATVKRLDGSEVVIKVTPVSKSPGRNEVTIESHDAEQRSLHELRRRAGEIAARLQERGLAVGASQLLPGSVRDARHAENGFVEAQAGETTARTQKRQSQSRSR